MYDITHFDGKFFSTLQYLLLKPGFLSHEYLRGRRASYLHPIRMYVFTSAFFFLVFFNLKKEDEMGKINVNNPTAAEVMKKLVKKNADLKESVNDSLPDMAKRKIVNAIAASDSDIALLKRDTTAKDKLQSVNNFTLFSGDNNTANYRNTAAYDSAQQILPASERDNFIERRFIRQGIHLREKYHGDKKAIWTSIFEKFRHLFPQMLFVSLPLFALLLQLLYIRKKRFFYVNHVVFTIHLYCGTFIIILAGLVLDNLCKAVGYEGDWVGGIFSILGFFYWYKSMRNFYEQRRGKTILKYLLVLFLSLFIMTFLFTGFFIFSAMAI